MGMARMGYCGNCFALALRPAESPKRPRGSGRCRSWQVRIGPLDRGARGVAGDFAALYNPLDCSGSHFAVLISWVGRLTREQPLLAGPGGEEIRLGSWLARRGSERAAICRCRDSTLPLRCARDGCETDDAE